MWRAGLGRRRMGWGRPAAGLEGCQLLPADAAVIHIYHIIYMIPYCSESLAVRDQWRTFFRNKKYIGGPMVVARANILKYSAPRVACPATPPAHFLLAVAMLLHGQCMHMRTAAFVELGRRTGSAAP